MKRRPAAVLRWHVSRAGESFPSAANDRESVQIDLVRGNDLCIRTWERMMDSPATITMDSLPWWDDTGEGLRLTVDPGLLLEALTRRNLLIDLGNQYNSRTTRRIVEDMVFLQFFQDNGEFHSVWEKNYPDSIDPSEMIQAESARWMDFTAQARRAASTVYGNLLRGPVLGRSRHGSE